jgi:hypothetical protein
MDAAHAAKLTFGAAAQREVMHSLHARQVEAESSNAGLSGWTWLHQLMRLQAFDFSLNQCPPRISFVGRLV